MQRRDIVHPQAVATPRRRLQPERLAHRELLLGVQQGRDHTQVGVVRAEKDEVRKDFGKGAESERQSDEVLLPWWKVTDETRDANPRSV